MNKRIKKKVLTSQQRQVIDPWNYHNIINQHNLKKRCLIFSSYVVNFEYFNRRTDIHGYSSAELGNNKQNIQMRTLTSPILFTPRIW
jgi:hypothetical protein